MIYSDATDPPGLDASGADARARVERARIRETIEFVGPTKSNGVGWSPRGQRWSAPSLAYRGRYDRELVIGKIGDVR